MIKFGMDLGMAIITQHPWIWQVGLGGFGLVAITAVIALFKARATKPKEAKKEKKSK